MSGHSWFSLKLLMISYGVYRLNMCWFVQRLELSSLSVKSLLSQKETNIFFWVSKRRIVRLWDVVFLDLTKSRCVLCFHGSPEFWEYCARLTYISHWISDSLIPWKNHANFEAGKRSIHRDVVEGEPTSTRLISVISVILWETLLWWVRWDDQLQVILKLSFVEYISSHLDLIWKVVHQNESVWMSGSNMVKSLFLQHKFTK